MASRILTPVDMAWMAIDSAQTPMHSGALFIFSQPEGVEEDAAGSYLRSVLADMTRNVELSPPWNQKLTRGLGRILPVMVDDDKADVEYHVRLSALPAPGGERELGELISRLHSHPLDMAKPLWECHLISGLYDNRFAIYVKIHQVLTYGMAGVSSLLSTLSEDPYQRGLSPVWGSAGGTPTPSTGSLAGLAPGIAGAARSLFDQLSLDSLGKAVSDGTPKTMLNGRLRGNRRVATQSYSDARINAIMDEARVDQPILLQYLASSALRRYLKEHNNLPDESLIAGIALEVDSPDATPENPVQAIGMTRLATDVADPLERLSIIHKSNSRARQRVEGLSREGALVYSMGLMQPYIASVMSRVTGMRGVRLPWNLFVSCYRGPKGPLYFNGAPLESYHPLPPLWQGSGLSFSGVDANGALSLSVVGDRDRVPHMQRLATYMGDALSDLEGKLDLTAKTGTEG